MTSDLGNKEIFAKNLKYYMGVHQKSRNDICTALGFAYPTFSDWANGKKYPRIDKIEMLADYFGIQKSDLIENKGKKPPRIGVKIPVLGRVAAGVPITAVEDILDYEEITPELAATGDFFALSISGDSMEPRMKDGDVVIVRQQSDVDSGQVAIVLVNGDDATCKVVQKQESGILLVAWNPAYPPKFYTSADIESIPVSVLGRVIELRGKF